MKTLFSLLFFCLVIGTGCAHPDKSQLTPQGNFDYKALQVVKVVNDVSDAVITANIAGKLADQPTSIILTVNKQVLDVVQQSGTDSTWRSKSVIIANNALDAAPSQWKEAVRGYIQTVLNVLQEVR